MLYRCFVGVQQGLARGFDFYSWSLGSEGLLSPFARMDDESSEEDLDFFVVLDVSAARSKTAESSSRVSSTAARGKRRVGVPKRRLGSTGEPPQGIGGPGGIIVWEWVGLARMSPRHPQERVGCGQRRYLTRSSLRRYRARI
jgi:hypothetical protein